MAEVVTLRSSKGCAPSARRMVFSWPLPRIKTKSPFLAREMAFSMADLRLVILIIWLSCMPDFLHPSSNMAMIFSGDSSRESSSVKMQMSLYFPAISPRSIRVVSSRRPAPPKREMMWPDLCG